MSYIVNRNVTPNQAYLFLLQTNKKERCGPYNALQHNHNNMALLQDGISGLHCEPMTVKQWQKIENKKTPVKKNAVGFLQMNLMNKLIPTMTFLPATGSTVN
jgi:hypothetical protein